MVIQNQERVIALLNEINEVKGNFIDNETANQLTPELKAVWDEIFVCKNEIELILRSKTVWRCYSGCLPFGKVI